MIITKIFHNPILFILSLVLVCLKIPSTTSLDHQLVVMDGVISKKCVDKEMHALLDVKKHIHDPLGVLSSWNPEEEDDCCKWSGVTCNIETGHITELDMSFSQFGGKISPSLLNLTYLNHLDLFGNNFHGPIPRFIGSMTQLKYLDISSNMFNGTFPREFGNLTNLEHFAIMSLKSCSIENLNFLSNMSHLFLLDLGWNSLAKANKWVDVIVDLRKLEKLSLWECDLSKVTHPYSSSINSSSSSSIVTLSLSDNNLNSSMYRWLFPLTSNKLDFLDLGLNKLDRIPKYFGNLSSLTYLGLSGNSIAVNFSDFLSNLSGLTSVTLQELDASSNQLIGSIPNEIQKFSSLKTLDLSYNHLNGFISDEIWELPMLETLDASSNFLRGAIFENVGVSKLSHVDMSNNSLEVVHMLSNLSYVEYIDLSSSKLGPHFPKWILILKTLTYLDIANTRISDTIPLNFWDTWPSRLIYLNLSFNNMSGEVPDLLSNFDLYPRIDLSSNNFYGPIHNVPSTLALLNLSKNKLCGGIYFICQIVYGSLAFLDLSYNSFTGRLPDCLWHFKELSVLNLGHNNLSGSLPPSIGYLVQLEVLYLYNNSFSGELPLFLQNCTDLVLLDLGVNEFIGNVPVWIGEKLHSLYALSLRSNNFYGTIPSQLCQLVNLQLLDLSMNNLHGTIPSCVNKLSKMVEEGLLLHQIVHHYNLLNAYVDRVMVEWQGNIREFSSNLGLLTSIDLSSNNLSGQIPNELTNLRQLVALNLSKNSLRGEIPLKIDEMKNLLTLDLSRNNFSGEIPSSMSHMTSLNYLDVSDNKLTGKIPYSTQLQSFEPSRYIGNP